MRVDKVLEERQIGSRKTVKRLIQQKRVKVDGIAITNGSFNVEQTIHQLTVDGNIITIPSHRYYMLHKPNGVVTAKTDANCQTIFDLIADDDQNDQLYPVGRLDRDTEGLLLITDNGQLGYQLLLPDKKVEKVYEATINDIVTEADITAFAEGIVFIGGEKCLP
ncbi:MAG TPA: 16S rRNA pseudouridine(516) synthase, partial [Candidatus Jeotgalibaca merdavium]|nr:16S rRNA pseudouridine(516) synthase [Candidatus Jeotgalibaca merdavium]